MRRFRAAVLAVTAVVLASGSAAAQEPRPLEFGIDAGITFGLDSPRVTVISIPAQNFRVGFLMGDRTSIEPAFALQSISSGGTTVTAWNTELGVLWHFGQLRSGTYLRPFVGVTGVSGGGTSDTQASLGVGLGLKVPVVDQRVAWRFEANYAHAFESGDTGDSNQIGVRAGLSFFTR